MSIYVFHVPNAFQMSKLCTICSNVSPSHFIALCPMTSLLFHHLYSPLAWLISSVLPNGTFAFQLHGESFAFYQLSVTPSSPSPRRRHAAQARASCRNYLGNSDQRKPLTWTTIFSPRLIPYSFHLLPIFLTLPISQATSNSTHSTFPLQNHRLSYELGYWSYFRCVTCPHGLNSY